MYQIILGPAIGAAAVALWTAYGLVPWLGGVAPPLDFGSVTILATLTALAAIIGTGVSLRLRA